MSWDNIDGIALAAGWLVRDMNPCHSWLFSLPKNFQTGSGADPASYFFLPISFPGINLSGCAVDHSYEGWNFNSGNYLFTTDTK